MARNVKKDVGATPRNNSSATMNCSKSEGLWCCELLDVANGCKQNLLALANIEAEHSPSLSCKMLEVSMVSLTSWLNGFIAFQGCVCHRCSSIDLVMTFYMFSKFPPIYIYIYVRETFLYYLTAEDSF